MLNKELLMIGKEEFPTLEGGFVFKVGLFSYAGETAYGYLQYKHQPSNGGYTPRVPYWNLTNKRGEIERFHITHFIKRLGKSGSFSVYNATLTDTPALGQVTFKFKRVFPNEEDSFYTTYHIAITEDDLDRIVGYIIDPPRRVPRPRHTRTYRVDYYVEEDPWEAQDAE